MVGQRASSDLDLAREQRGLGLARRERLVLLVAALAHDAADRRADDHAHRPAGRGTDDRAARETRAAALRTAAVRSGVGERRIHGQADCQHARDQRGFTKLRSPGAHVPSPVVRRPRAVLLSRFISTRIGIAPGSGKGDSATDRGK